MTRHKLNKHILTITISLIITSIVITILINLCLWKKNNHKITVFNSFGIAVVSSESMEPKLSKNDIIVIQKKEKYEVNDIVIYKKEKNLIVHRIIEINKNEIITKGDANKKEDKPINSDNIYGKVIFNIPFIGILIIFLKSNYGIISIIALIVIIFIYSCKKELKKMSKD